MVVSRRNFGKLFQVTFIQVIGLERQLLSSRKQTLYPVTRGTSLSVANPADSRTQEVETTIEIALPQGRAENLIAQLNSAVNQAEQVQDQQVQQTVQRPVGRLRGAKV